jgi:hypothetical protein
LQAAGSEYRYTGWPFLTRETNLFGGSRFIWSTRWGESATLT